MAKKNSFKEISASQLAVNRFREDYGRRLVADVMVKQGFDSSECVRCTIYIGHGRHDDHNMPYVSVIWPDNCSIAERFNIHSDFDCAYTRIRYQGNGVLTLYLDNIFIDIMVCDEINESEE